MSYVISMYLKWEPRRNVLLNRTYNDFVKSAMEMRIDFSRNLFQLSLVFTGGLWGLLIAKEGEAVLVFNDYPELVMSVLATILLILSCICHIYYLDLVTDLYVEAGGMTFEKDNEAIADIFEVGVNYLFLTQVASLLAGAIISIFTFISTHKLKQ